MSIDDLSPSQALRLECLRLAAFAIRDGLIDAPDAITLAEAFERHVVGAVTEGGADA